MCHNNNDNNHDNNNNNNNNDNNNDNGDDNQFSPDAILNKIMRETERQINEREFTVFLHLAKETFGYNMRNISWVKGVLLDELSNLTDISRSALEDYQNGLGEFSFEEVCRIVFALGVGMKDVFRE